MPDLRLAVHSTDPEPRGGAVRFAPSWWRSALLISLTVHAAGGYLASRVAFRGDEPPPLPDFPDFFWSVERVVPPPSEPVIVEAPFAPEVLEEPEVQPKPVEEAPAPAPAPQAANVTPVVTLELAPRAPTRTELDEARARAADEIIAEREEGDGRLTFTIDDIAGPPRPEPEERPKYNIFNPGPGAAKTSVGQVGQGRSRLGNKVRELCHGLTGGFLVVFQGFGLGSACGGPDDEPSGLFPEVRPAYLDLLPECAESEPEQPELAAAAPFSTVKCRLVRPVPVERWAYPGQPAAAKP